MMRCFFSTLPRQLLAVLMVGGVALNGANVIGRYFFGSPIFWAEEVMVYMMIWGIFIGLIAVTWDREHIAMDLLSSRLPPAMIRLRDSAIAVVLFACAVFVTVQSWQIVSMFVQTGAVSAAASVPKAIPHAGILIGFGLAALAAVIRIRGLRQAAQAGELAQGQL